MGKAGVLIFLLALLPASAFAAGPTAEIIKKKTPYGEISYPQLSGLADENIQKSINDIIVAEAATWTCDFDGEQGDPARVSFDALSTLRLVDERYLSFTVAKDYYCGGAYPDAHMDVVNYDLQTGVPLPINALLVPEMLDEKLTAYLLKDHKFDPEGCDRDAFSENNWDYYRTADVIVFLPRLPHAMQACVEEFPVPAEDLKTYMWHELEEDRE